MKIEITIKEEDAPQTRNIIGHLQQIGDQFWYVYSVNWAEGVIPSTIDVIIELKPIDKGDVKFEASKINIFYLMEKAIL